jgi:Holliday junction resolvasome RuvABC endonuclease subunit
MNCVIAMDLSSTSTGVCIDSEDGSGEGITLTWAPKGNLLTRARVMRDNARDGLRFNPDVVVIEAIATRHTQTAIAIGYVHALVLDAISDHVPVITVSPASLKKWATGKGNADKTAMLLAAKREGWQDPPGATDDQADAWWLWALGHATEGTWKVPETAYRRAVLSDLGFGT